MHRGVWGYVTRTTGRRRSLHEAPHSATGSIVPIVVHLNRVTQKLFCCKGSVLPDHRQRVYAGQATGEVGGDAGYGVLQLHRLRGAWRVWTAVFSCRYPPVLCFHSQIVNTEDELCMPDHYGQCSRRLLEAVEESWVIRTLHKTQLQGQSATSVHV